jgi:hypothetical protein
MDFTKIAKITIELEALQDLLNKQTGNSIANEDIPEILRKAIQSGCKVLLTDINGRNTCVLRLKDDGGFAYESPA